MTEPIFTRKATWSITLDTICPVCESYQDLVKEENYDRLGVKFGEVDTVHSKLVPVQCKECSHNYYVDLEMGE